METCDLPLRARTSDDELQAAVTAMRVADLSVVVVAPRSDARALRSLLGPELFVVPLAADTPLDEAARGVFGVPGRCVVVARRGDQGWDFVATSGTPVTPVPPPPPVPEEPRPPRIPSLTGSSWLGVGVRTGYPALATPTYSLLVGPVTAEAGRTWLVGSVWRDRWWQVGVMAPVSRAQDRAVTVGVVAGERALRIAGYDTRAGPTARLQAEVAWRVENAPHLSAFACAIVGGDAAITPFAHLPGRRVDVYPVAELTVGFRASP